MFAFLAGISRPSLLILWFAVLILCAVIEGLTVGLTSIWFCAGALGALICVGAGLGFWPSFWVFVAVSVLCLILVRPLARKHLNSRTQATNADRILGGEGLVTEDIDDLKGTGYVTVRGQAWMARTGTEGLVIPKGARVRILRIEGVKVYVEPAEDAGGTGGSNGR